MAALTMAGACGGDPSSPAPTGVVFTIQVADETYKVRTTNPTAIAAMRARLASGNAGVVIGTLRSGNGGVNAPYGWHLDPATVTPADFSIELCDGRPSDVQQDMPYWINNVRSYCPWGAKVIREGS